MLDSSLVEDIFARMLARYGSSWRAKWQGVDPEAVKADWAQMLSGASFDSISYGLSYLPVDFPPTAGQFAELCRQRRVKPLALPSPEGVPMPPDVAAELAKIGKEGKGSPKAWAYGLRDHEAAGEIISSNQRTMYRAALGDGDAYIPPDDQERTQRLKAEAAKRVSEYASRNGIPL